jgi:hypothetical protein
MYVCMHAWACFACLDRRCGFLLVQIRNQRSLHRTHVLRVQCLRNGVVALSLVSHEHLPNLRVNNSSPSSKVCALHMLAFVCVRSKSWLAARKSLRLARPARTRRSRRLRATLAEAPALFAHAFGPCHMEKTYGDIKVADARRQSVCAHSKDWRCCARVTPARSPCRAHVACAPHIRQRQSFRALAVGPCQMEKTNGIGGSTTGCESIVHRSHTCADNLLRNSMRENHWSCRKRGMQAT